jgi:hypothetical protein
MRSWGTEFRVSIFEFQKAQIAIRHPQSRRSH